MFAVVALAAPLRRVAFLLVLLLLLAVRGLIPPPLGVDVLRSPAAAAGEVLTITEVDACDCETAPFVVEVNWDRGATAGNERGIVVGCFTVP